MSRLEIGIYLTHANDLLGSDLAGLTDTVRAIEAAGIDYLVVADHVVLGEGMQGSHNALGAPLPYPPDEPYPDPLITLAAVAAVTDRIRLATGILIAPLRSPVLLAKMVSTLAVLSAGRLDLGVGSGWQEEEFAALGIPIAGKAARLDDTVSACRALWQEAPASFSSATVSFAGLYCSPRPDRPVPIWYAGKPIPATLKRVVRSGAGWLPLRCPGPDEVREIRGVLGRLCEGEGRDPNTVGIRAALPVHRNDGRLDLDATRAHAALLNEAGITGVHLSLRDLASNRAELDEALAEVATLVS